MKRTLAGFAPAALTSLTLLFWLASLTLLFSASATSATAQTPAPRPQSSPDATRPPAVEPAPPQTPPATTPPPQVTPAPNVSAPTRPATTTTLNPATQSPAAGGASQTSTPAPELTTSSLLEARPLPPLPAMSRLGVEGGSAVALTLNEAVRRALENNSEIEVARGEVLFAESTLRVLETVYEPIFQVVPSYSSRVTPVASVLGGSDQSGAVTTTDINYDGSMVRLFRKGGGRYEFFFNNTRETTSSSFSNLSPFYSSSLGVTFTQPLLRGRAIDANRRAIRIQQRLVAQTDADFRRRTIDIITQVQLAYWDLVFALRDQQNRLANLNLTRELYRQNETRIIAGSVAPFERAEVQTELASRESDLLAALQSVTLAENNLKRLILHDPLAPDWSAQLVPADEPAFDETPVRLPDVLAEARANRPELNRLRLQREISDLDLQFFKDQSRPRVDLEATVATTGLAGSPVAPADAPVGGPSDSVPSNLLGGYGQTLRNLARLKTRNVVVGVRIELPLRNRRAKEELAGARIRRTQLDATSRTQEQTIEAEVRNAAQAVEIARQRVLAAREARKNADLQLQGERRLYEVGRSTTFLLFQRQNQLAGARNLQLRAETDYNKALAELQRATSTTLRANNVTVETPTSEQ